MAIWLFGIYLTVLLMIFVGGITRLTGSGLSIVEWNLISGILPPLTSDAWHSAFAQYKLFPQFAKINPNMDLLGFKEIFFWEYVHRLLGRLIGSLYIIPYLYFVIRYRLPKLLNIKLMFLLLLGSNQGLLGWYMVKSGLIDNPFVSHLRLWAHLALALLIMMLAISLAHDLLERKPKIVDKSLRLKMIYFSLGQLILMVVQITYGAFTAGLKAGYIYPTFPKMNGYWFPPGFFDAAIEWTKFFFDPAYVQFIHRWLGFTLLLYTVIFAFYFLTRVRIVSSRKYFFLMLTITGIQFLSGILVLVFVVPIPLASFHQVLAALLLTSAVLNLQNTWVLKPS